MFSVNSEEEAKDLLILACGKNLNNEFIARELAHEQTLENLQTFGDRLADMHAKYVAERFHEGERIRNS